MDLLEIRKALVQWSGRYDLVDPEWNDEGADFFINSGVKYLDQRTDFFPMSEARISKAVDPGQLLVYMENCRYLKEVFIIQESKSTKLEKLPYDQIIQYFPKSNLNNISLDDPKFFVPGSFRIDEEQVFIESKTPYDSILILPPPANTLNIVIHGSFFSPKLTEDYQSNAWSVQYSNILLMAAMRELEIFHRNTSGVRDWERAILEELKNIQMDQISEQISGVNQMEG